jgi:hypothetical protein
MILKFAWNSARSNLTVSAAETSSRWRATGLFTKLGIG